MLEILAPRNYVSAAHLADLVGAVESRVAQEVANVDLVRRTRARVVGTTSCSAITRIRRRRADFVITVLPESEAILSPQTSKRSDCVTVCVEYSGTVVAQSLAG